MKQAYISPKNGELCIAIRRDQRPEVYVTIDMAAAPERRSPVCLVGSTYRATRAAHECKGRR